MDKTDQPRFWLCEKCGHTLSGNVDDKVMSIHGVNGQKIKAEYLNITGTCKKCGQFQQKKGIFLEEIGRERLMNMLDKSSNEAVLEALGKEFTRLLRENGKLKYPNVYYPGQDDD